MFETVEQGFELELRVPDEVGVIEVSDGHRAAEHRETDEGRRGSDRDPEYGPGYRGARATSEDAAHGRGGPIRPQRRGQRYITVPLLQRPHRHLEVRDLQQR